MKTDDTFREYVINDVLTDIPNITSKAMFGGFGLYQDGVIFSILADSRIFFRVDDNTRAEFEKRGSRPFTYLKQGEQQTVNSYWELPVEILEDREALPAWVDAAVKASAERDQKQS
jgi:DNA transformation protein